jgi:hypothetical protein
MMLAPVFFVMALILVSGVRRGEAATAPSAA